MYYTIVPYDVMFMDMDKPRKFFEIRKNNVVFKLEEIDKDNFVIFDIFSLNPGDYMNPAFSPGTIIKKIDLISSLI